MRPSHIFKLFTLVLMILIVIIPVHSFNDLEKVIEDAVLNSRNMELDGYYVTRINDYITQARVYLENNNLVMANYSIGLANIAIENARLSKNLIDEITLSVSLAESNGINTTTSVKYLDLARSYNLVEDYDNAIKNAKKSKSLLAYEVGVRYSYIRDTINFLDKKEASFGIDKGISDSLYERFLRMKDDLALEEADKLYKESAAYNVSLSHVDDVKNTISEFEMNNLSTLLFSDILASIVFSIKNDDQPSLQKYLTDYDKQKQAFDESTRYLNLIKKKVDELKSGSVDISLFEERYISIRERYIRQDYIDTAKQSKILYDELETFESDNLLKGALNTVDLTDYMKRHKVSILISLFLFVNILFFSYGTLNNRLIELRISMYKKQINVLTDLLADAQRKYFKEKSISRDSYNQLVDKFQEKLVMTRERLYLLDKKK